MGDMTDDQLDMDARVESSAMTPQEWAEKLSYDLSFAAPEMHLTHIVRRMAEAMAVGAQQERERLRMKPIMGDEDNLRPYPLPKWVKTPTPRGEAPIDLLEHFRDWLLADPDEADR